MPINKTETSYSLGGDSNLLSNEELEKVISEIMQLKKNGQVHSGMIPKLDNAFKALQAGVEQVIIGKAEKLQQLTEGKAGTTLKLEA